MMTAVILIIIAYLMGSISSAVLVCHVFDLPDPRTSGSGNPGATNVLRHGNKKAAIITLLLDILKGVIPVILTKIFLPLPWVISAAALAAFLRHLYPIFFQFKGGKGVATAFGVFTAVYWPVGILLLLTWLSMAFVFRYSSLSALTAALLAPIFMLVLTKQPLFVLLALIMSTLLIWRHRSNIHKLRNGTEDQIKLKSSV
jgi:glycerol-3-phosphate acyltransferase PlsY